MTEKVLDKEKQTSKQKLEPPKNYHVIILNDDFTPMPFVTDLLMKYFNQSEDQANRTMLEVHKLGKGIAGTYPKDIAETKVKLTNDFAQSEGHSLMAQVEKSS